MRMLAFHPGFCFSLLLESVRSDASRILWVPFGSFVCLLRDQQASRSAFFGLRRPAARLAFRSSGAVGREPREDSTPTSGSSAPSGSSWARSASAASAAEFASRGGARSRGGRRGMPTIFFGAPGGFRLRRDVISIGAMGREGEVEGV